VHVLSKKMVQIQFLNGLYMMSFIGLIVAHLSPKSRNHNSSVLIVIGTCLQLGLFHFLLVAVVVW
jgi:hypothetical protein